MYHDVRLVLLRSVDCLLSCHESRSTTIECDSAEFCCVITLTCSRIHCPLETFSNSCMSSIWHFIDLAFQWSDRPNRYGIRSCRQFTEIVTGTLLFWSYSTNRCAMQCQAKISLYTWAGKLVWKASKVFSFERFCLLCNLIQIIFNFTF